MVIAFRSTGERNSCMCQECCRGTSRRLGRRVDSKRKSATEALLNSFGGYPIGYAIGIILLPASVGWIWSDPFVASLFITAVYAAASFLRSYYLRRIFARYGIEFNLILLAAEYARRLAGAVQAGRPGSSILNNLAARMNFSRSMRALCGFRS